MVKTISLMPLILIILVMIMTTIITANFLRSYDALSSFYRYLQSEPLSEIACFLDKETLIQRRRVTCLESQDGHTASLTHSNSVVNSELLTSGSPKTA